PPVLELPAHVVVNATSPAGATVMFSSNGVCTPASGSVFAIGTTTVACTASDDAGNTAAGSFDVTGKGAAEQLHDLAVSVVGTTRLPQAVKTALVARIDAALAETDTRTTCTLLSAVATIARLAGPAGAPFVADAVRFRAVLGC